VADFRDDDVRARAGERLARRRHQLGLSGAALAALTGVSRGTIANFETGRTSLSVEAHHAILVALGAEPDMLLRETVCGSCGGFPPDGFVCVACGEGNGVCGGCGGHPPPGFSCQACGATTEREPAP
jgi:DNA-binding XRE family transcriptional regulator